MTPISRDNLVRLQRNFHRYVKGRHVASRKEPELSGGYLEKGFDEEDIEKSEVEDGESGESKTQEIEEEDLEKAEETELYQSLGSQTEPSEGGSVPGKNRSWREIVM